MSGEYGLWVQRLEDEGTEKRLETHWITDATGPGFLEVWREGTLRHRAETPASFLHSDTFPVPEAGRLLLRYGAVRDSGDRHETRVRLPLDPPRPVVRLDAVDSLYVVGDVHGEFDRLFRILRAAGLVDREERWTGGRAHLVLLGDIFDRGPDVTKALWFLYGLQDEAREAGGDVHVVLGNHEIMILTGDLRYVAPKERHLAELRSTSYTDLFDPRRTVLGGWLASRPAVMRIGPVLLAHGGVGAAFADRSIEALDDSLASYIDGDVFRWLADSTVRVAPMDSAAVARRIDFFFADESVFWHRGYLRPPVGGGTADDSLGDLLDRVLRRHDSRLHVVAHTTLPRIEARFGGRLIGVDLRRPASEMLLLVRERNAYARYRIDAEGTMEPVRGGARSP